MGKEKKGVKREYSAGGAVFRKEDGKILWLVIQPKGGKKFYDQIRWQLPKGWLDEGESSREAAVREVAEEGGVKAEIIEKIDSIKVFFRDICQDAPKQLVFKIITFYLMKCQRKVKEGPGWETKEIAWLPFEEAHERLTFKSEKEVLAKGRKILEKKQKESKLFD